MDQNAQRAIWTANLALAYTDDLTSGERLAVLNRYFDMAFVAGASDEIRRDIELMKARKEVAR